MLNSKMKTDFILDVNSVLFPNLNQKKKEKNKEKEAGKGPS